MRRLQLRRHTARLPCCCLGWGTAFWREYCVGLVLRCHSTCKRAGAASAFRGLHVSAVEVFTLFQRSGMGNEQENSAPLLYSQFWSRSKQASFKRYMSITELTFLRRNYIFCHYSYFLWPCLMILLCSFLLLSCHPRVMKTG